MGISIDSARFLLDAWRGGARFDATLTLGRQDVAISPGRLERLLAEYGVSIERAGAEIRALVSQPERRFEGFLRALGAKTVTACDASPYEGASLQHDLNEPIPAAWERQYTAVIDGGTLEHVFHVPNAIANCLRWTQVGGHVFLFTPANNHFGHGFYQFSPELFYRVCSPENGFTVERMVALADSNGSSKLFGMRYTFPITGPWYETADPAAIRERVTLINRDAVVLFVQAKRVSGVAPFATLPQQSDYVARWQDRPPEPAVRQTGAGQRRSSWLRSRLPEHVWREWLPRMAWIVDPLRRRRFLSWNSFRNARFYRRVR
jgi:hypothetical protein